MMHGPTRAKKAAALRFADDRAAYTEGEVSVRGGDITTSLIGGRVKQSVGRDDIYTKVDRIRLTADRPDRPEARGSGGLQKGGSDPTRAGRGAGCRGRRSRSSWPSAEHAAKKPIALVTTSIPWLRTRRPSPWPSRWPRGRGDERSTPGPWARPLRGRRGAWVTDKTAERDALPPGSRRTQSPGRRQPCRHRLPRQPGRKPSQPRPAADPYEPSGEAAGRVPRGTGNPKKLAADNPAVTDFRYSLADSHS